MSRGPGRLQRRIIAAIEAQPGEEVSYRRLRRTFPHEVRSRNFHRALRGLVRQGELSIREDQRLGRYVLRERPARVGDVVPLADKDLAEILALLPREVRADALADAAPEGYGKSTAPVVS